MMRTLKLFGLGAALVLWALATGGQGQIGLGEVQEQPPCTVTLAPGQSIQEAIDSAPDGAVICLEPGEWEENLVIEKSITLRAAEIKAEPDVVIRSLKRDWPVILIKSDQEIEARIEGLKVTGAFGDCREPERICPYGIEVPGHAKAVIQNNTLSGNGCGIMMLDSSLATITNNTLSGNGYGIEMWYSSQATIRDNKIFNNKGYGVALYQRPCSNIDLFEGKVEGSGNEIHANAKGDVCPEELEFLMTDEGGCYGPKC